MNRSRERDAATINRQFYDALWADTYLILPEHFNTWPLVRELNSAGSRRMEIGPGLRPRLPIPGTCFIEISLAVLSSLARHGGFVAQGRAEVLPFPDAAFDLVMAMDIIEHVDDDESVFRELARVIRPGGILVLSSPLHPDSWTSFDDVVGHRRRYQPEELLARLIRNGLTVERSAIYGPRLCSPPQNPTVLQGLSTPRSGVCGACYAAHRRLPRRDSHPLARHSTRPHLPMRLLQDAP